MGSHVRGSGTEDIIIPGDIRELCEGCFKGCRSLRRVTLGLSSSLERIGVSCFEATGVEEVSVPDSVRELCDGCFKGCKSLRRVTFGLSSSLERIGVEAFGALKVCVHWLTTCGLVEISIPDSVRELCDGCFKGCSSLQRVTFGPSSSLERIGVEAFGAGTILRVKLRNVDLLKSVVLIVCVSCVMDASRGASVFGV